MPICSYPFFLMIRPPRVLTCVFSLVDFYLGKNLKRPAWPVRKPLFGTTDKPRMMRGTRWRPHQCRRPAPCRLSFWVADMLTNAGWTARTLAMIGSSRPVRWSLKLYILKTVRSFYALFIHVFFLPCYGIRVVCFWLLINIFWSFCDSLFSGSCAVSVSPKTIRNWVCFRFPPKFAFRWIVDSNDRTVDSFLFSFIAPSVVLCWGPQCHRCCSILKDAAPARLATGLVTTLIAAIAMNEKIPRAHRQSHQVNISET